MGAIQEVKSRQRLEAVVAESTALSGHGDRLVGRCPFHDDRTPSLVIFTKSQTWRCFGAGCGLGGDVIDFVGYRRFGTRWNSRDKQMLAEVLRELQAGGTVTAVAPEPQPAAASSGPSVLEPGYQVLLHAAASLYHTALWSDAADACAARAFLQTERGLDEGVLRREGVGYARGTGLRQALAALGFSDEEGIAVGLLTHSADRVRESLAGRVIFLERDRTGRVLHLSGRRFASWLPSDSAKYLSLRGHAKPVYGWASLDRRASSKPVILVESLPDRLTLLQWGFDALATLGTFLSQSQTALLRSLRRPLIIIPHNDADPGKGHAAARRWAEQIGQGTLAVLPSAYKDVNELARVPGGRAIVVDVIGRSIDMIASGISRTASLRAGRHVQDK